MAKKEIEEVVEDEDSNEASDETEKTETPIEDNTDQTVPYDRFKEVNEIKKAREKENKELRQKLEDLEKAELEKNEQYKELSEKLQGELEQERAKTQKVLAETAIKLAASQANANNAEDVYRLIDQDSIEVDENGFVTNAPDIIEALKKDKPYLFSSGKVGKVGEGASPTTAGDKEVFAWSDIREKRKNQAWYEENKDNIRQWGEQGRIDYSR